MSEKWNLQAGRNIETPDGTFYLTYNVSSNGAPDFRNFVRLDAIARQVAALPELIEALKACSCFWGSEELYDSPVAQQARAAIAKATGESNG